MKRGKGDLQCGRRFKSSQILIALAILYLVFISTKFRSFLDMASSLSGDDTLAKLDVEIEENVNVGNGDPVLHSDNTETFHRILEDNGQRKAPERPHNHPRKSSNEVISTVSLLNKNDKWMTRKNGSSVLADLQKMARDAWVVGLKVWEETRGLSPEELNLTINQQSDGRVESCPSSMSLNGDEMEKAGNIMLLPCGLAIGSSITLVGKPRLAHKEYVPVPGSFFGIMDVLVSQFALELRGLNAVDGEDPPRIFHFNPRLKGDWSKVPVIEHNTCYRMQWGKPQRCDGIPSKEDDDTVDGFPKCEKWIRNDIIDAKESKTTWWLKRFIGRAKKPEMTWPFPFVEERLFVLTLRAGVEGYHVHVGGRHVTSFLYRTGYALEDATGLAIDGDADLHSIYATSLPVSHPSLSLQQVLEMSEQWKPPALPETAIYLFIGILSATNHFAERMAIRKTWMQFEAIRSSQIVVRFFVALNGRKEVNALLKMEAEYFGDVVILPFIDRYELVVLKTVAICQYGVHNLSAEYILKCDDDTFVRVDAVLNKIKTVSSRQPMYMGNLNILHRPLRFGKWAVSFEEWPSEVYPPYANGPGYVISADIARFVASHHANQRLKLFKMEAVSMGMWVQDFNRSSAAVHYSHSFRFCQKGCIDDYITAHYQSPKQMICLWDNLKRGRSTCCNIR